MKKVFVIILALVLVLALSVTVFACSDKGGAVKKESRVLEFGSYPQSEVTDRSITSALTPAAGALPTPSDSADWISYEYYICGSNETDYMWYIDLEYSGEKYRGVYFTSYRPYGTTCSSSTDNSYQDDNGYTTGAVYWFKYEPIKWRILSESNGEALILCEMIIDSREYCNYTTDTQFEHNGGTGYPNNYELSDIRKWLNNTFYNTAFSDLQRDIILLTTVDNSARSTNPNFESIKWDNGNNDYACADTEDYVFLLSEQEASNDDYGFHNLYNDDPVRRKKSTDYAKAQGLWTSTDSSYDGSGPWWLRSPYAFLSNYARDVIYCNFAYYDHYVSNAGGGVVPALRIKLS